MKIRKMSLRGLGVKGKPKCPYCGNPLQIVFSDVRGGHTSEKCNKCGRIAIVDLETLIAYKTSLSNTSLLR